MSKRIVVGGVPNCGKSTLTASIYMEMRARGAIVGIHELDVFENTIPFILGLESWEQRLQVKPGHWANPRICQAITGFESDESQFVLGDLTGIIDNLLEKMVKKADSAIVIGKDQQTLQVWLDFFNLHKIPVIVKVISYLDGFLIPEVSFKEIVFVKNLQRQIVRNAEICKIVDILLSR